MPSIQYAYISGVSASKDFDETTERAYFDGTFTSDSVDSEDRIVHATNFPSIVEQVKAGVRVLDSHKHETNGIGKSVAAVANGNQVDGSFYILKGAEIDGEFVDLELEGQSYPTTKSWLIGLKDGMIDKLSMGWYSERNICNLCGNSIYSYPCRHWPGERFPVTDEMTGEERMEKCTYTCYGITVVEMSLVYYGANPDARLVEKAKALAADGHFSREQIDRIESKLNVAIVSNNERSYSVPLSTEDRNEIAGIVKTQIETAISAIQPPAAAPAAQAAAPVVQAAAPGMVNVLDSRGQVIRQMREDELPEQASPATADDIAKVVGDAVKPIAEKVEGIEKAMASGESAADRKAAIDENIKQYNRVEGKDGNEDEHRKYVESFPDIASIQKMTAVFKSAADKVLGGPDKEAGSQTPGVLDELETASPDEDDSVENPQRQ